MMTLPDLDTPIFDVYLPYTKKTLRFRPFLVKEEKLLLMAASSKDISDIINTTLQVVQNCMIDGDIKAIDLPFFEVDYIFITLRAKSVGETLDVNFVCNNIIHHQESDGAHKCGTIFPVALDILKADFINPLQSDSAKITLSVDAGVVMKYPSYKAMKLASETLDSKLDTIKASIDYIWKGDKVYKTAEIELEELSAYVDNFTIGQLKALERWVDNFPSFVVQTTKVCPKCGFSHEIVYRDFQNFF